MINHLKSILIILLICESLLGYTQTNILRFDIEIIYTKNNLNVLFNFNCIDDLTVINVIYTNYNDASDTVINDNILSKNVINNKIVNISKTNMDEIIDCIVNLPYNNVITYSENPQYSFTSDLFINISMHILDLGIITSDVVLDIKSTNLYTNQYLELCKMLVDLTYIDVLDELFIKDK